MLKYHLSIFLILILVSCKKPAADHHYSNTSGSTSGKDSIRITGNKDSVHIWGKDFSKNKDYRDVYVGVYNCYPIMKEPLFDSAGNFLRWGAIPQKPYIMTIGKSNVSNKITFDNRILTYEVSIDSSGAFTDHINVIAGKFIRTDSFFMTIYEGGVMKIYTNVSGKKQ